ncbi:MAG: substrate binding domain-containing protein [Burkholderiaceae bacterium]|nr:substrate binding domain-containing protein [Burkholderiaceae bacterium]
MTAPTNFLVDFDIEDLAQYLQRFPKVYLELRLNDTRFELIAKSIDLVFRIGPLQDSSLVARRQRDTYRYLVASPLCLSSAGVPQTVEELAEHECIGPPSSGGAQTHWYLDGPGGPRTVRVGGRFNSSTVGSRICAARMGLGASFLPFGVIVEDLAAGRLVRVLPEYRQDLDGAWIVYPSRRNISAAARTLAEFVAAKLTPRLSE